MRSPLLNMIEQKVSQYPGQNLVDGTQYLGSIQAATLRVNFGGKVLIFVEYRDAHGKDKSVMLKAGVDVVDLPTTGPRFVKSEEGRVMIDGDTIKNLRIA